MSDFKTRLAEEKIGLDEKLSKLELFLAPPNIKKLPKHSIHKLKIQIAAMNTYSECLACRLEDLNE